MAQIWQQPPDAEVTRSWSHRESNIDVSIRPTELSADHHLLYKEVEIAMTTLLEHIEGEGIYYEMEFRFYQIIPLDGTVWKMEGTSFSGLLLTFLKYFMMYCTGSLKAATLTLNLYDRDASSSGQGC